MIVGPKGLAHAGQWPAAKEWKQCWRGEAMAGRAAGQPPEYESLDGGAGRCRSEVHRKGVRAFDLSLGMSMKSHDKTGWSYRQVAMRASVGTPSQC